MLTVYRSNKAEWLAEVLAEKLRVNPPRVFEKVEILVNTWPTGRWLGEQIATVNGISALVEFPFPGAHLQKLVHASLSLESESFENPWESRQLIWPILESFPELLKLEEASHLHKWLNRNLVASPEKLCRDEWQLAKSIAYTFDEYIFYRPIFFT